ncbi:MAG TPA: YaaA family protein, partial [Erysipelotrichaceae bacterium]|nr:YaaA family protein [Erysipelotrichaceae bacterium]
LYKGVVYDCFNLNDFSENEINYLNEHVRIISALYGVLKPYDGIQPYRLDFTMKLNNINLNRFWKSKILTYFKKEDFILDCASQEFSHFLKPLKEKVHRIEFIDNVDGQDKVISYNAKKMRGLMAYYCIKNQVNSVEQIRNFYEEDYKYQTHHSDNSVSIFKRFSTSNQT